MSAVEINEAATAPMNENDQLFHELTWMERVQGFCILMSMALFATLMSWFALGMGAYWKYSMLSTLGSLLSMLSTIILMGPSAQLAYMFDEYRFNATVLYLCSMFLAFFVAIAFKSLPLCLLCGLLQYSALIWYSLSYVPYGRETLVNIIFRR
ncbi:Got1/Sft2-like family [Novymonas esmeraldas]|uniref:Vesicle transport protein n=1 Tax=Novymonas esmeraldas TaxID=1808958 RepID=A0AAW0F469_9TRYP